MHRNKLQYYEKGLMKRDIKYITPSQVGGQVGAAKSTATATGQESGRHPMKDALE